MEKAGQWPNGYIGCWKIKQVQTRQLYEGLYQVGCEAVAREKPGYLVAAVDPVNFEKPYVKSIEGISTVHKSTPPDLSGHARLAHGYPAITATIVNTQVPAISYANWFSYEIDFISQNKEIEQAFTPLAGYIRAIKCVLWGFGVGRPENVCPDRAA